MGALLLVALAAANANPGMGQPQGEEVARLGAVVAPLTKLEARARATIVDSGAVIDRVVPNGPAWRAGLRAEDVIIAVGDLPVATPQELVDALSAIPPESAVQLTFVRDGSTATLEVPRERAAARRSR